MVFYRKKGQNRAPIFRRPELGFHSEKSSELPSSEDQKVLSPKNRWAFSKQRSIQSRYPQDHRVVSPKKTTGPSIDSRPQSLLSTEDHEFVPPQKNIEPSIANRPQSLLSTEATGLFFQKKSTGSSLHRIFRPVSYLQRGPQGFYQ